MDTPRCHRGHDKVRRMYGWRCVRCDQDYARARKARRIADGSIPQPKPRWHSEAKPTELKCSEGHTRVRRPNGSIVCPTCIQARKRARRLAEQLTPCAHTAKGGWDGLLTSCGNMVCLACVIDEANQLRVANG